MRRRIATPMNEEDGPISKMITISFCMVTQQSNSRGWLASPRARQYVSIRINSEPV